MRRSSLVWSLLALVLGSVTAATAAAPGTSAAGTAAGQPLALAGGQPLRLSDATTDSLNWSGYYVVPHGRPVTRVTGQFVVPAVQSLLPAGFASTWVGIGGVDSADLIQAGVFEQTAGNPLTGPQYSAWYELLPASSTPLSGCRGDAACTVRPGDRFRITIVRVATNRWRISLMDSRRWSWTRTVGYTSSESSAEWITEAPTLLVAQTTIANLGRVTFDGRNTFTTAGSRARTIRQGHPVTVVLSPGGGIAEATPSTLDRDGDGFAVCTYATSCARPSS